MSIIEVTNLKKVYGDVIAVDDVSFSVHEREIFGILGPNGAGKTTTLEMIEGLREPDGGEIIVDRMPVWPRPGPIKRIIGVQLQSTTLFDYLTVSEMIALFGSFYKLRLGGKDIDGLLNAVGLTEKRRARVRELSGGQQQRLSIALALVNDPKIVFLDEPTTGLDPQARRRMWDVVREVNGEGKTIVLTTHYMEEAEVLCGRVAVMDHGKIMSLDSPANLIKSLGANAKVTFTCTPQLAVDELRALPAAIEVSEVDHSYVIYTGDVQNCVLGVLQAADNQRAKVENLSVSGANLEDVFLHLTGRGLRD